MKPFFRKTEKDDAVSPVVGVMLMLVVTIIIAATVAVFATGIGSGVDTIPVAQVSADYSQTNGLTITQLSGDMLELSEVEIIVNPSTGFKPSYRTLSWTVNKTGAAEYLKAGQSVLISKDKVQEAMFANSSSDNEYARYDNSSAYYGFNYKGGYTSTSNGVTTVYPTAVGNYFTLKLITLDGKLISETEVLIRP